VGNGVGVVGDRLLLVVVLRVVGGNGVKAVRKNVLGNG
jgi:hypothetical protein